MKQAALSGGALPGFNSVLFHFFLPAVGGKEGDAMRQIEWQDRFSIGVDIVDQAHRRLFAIVQKIMDLYIEKHEDKFACVEGIKYFRAYTAQHFAEEEAYMRQIGYAGYQNHKRRHDRMKRETLPALERELYETNFSVPAVQRFIGVCTGWLTGHIMIEDRAIVDKSAWEIAPARPGDELGLIRAAFLRPLQELFGGGVQLIGAFDPGDAIPDAQYYQAVYRGRGRKLRFELVVGESQLLYAAGLVFGQQFDALDEIVRFAMQEIAQNLLQRMEISLGEEVDAYQLEEDRFLEREDYERLFREKKPWRSLLFSAPHGCFAVCVDGPLLP